MKKKGSGGLFQYMADKYPQVFETHEKLGVELRNGGPLDTKTVHLVQLGAAAAAGLEGAVHSHARRALGAGVTPDEIYHSVVVLISTIGFPRAMAAASWCRDIIEDESE